jgi:WD40 repeat protein
LRLHRLRAPLVAAALIAFLAFGGSAAASVPGTSLPLHGYSRMVSDPSNNQLFVTGGSSDSAILVRNEDGSAKRSITGEAGAGGMVLDGGTLYVARCGWSVIDEIDTATLTRTGSISAPNIGGTCDLAEAGGALWYANSSNHLVSVTVDASHTTTDTGKTIDGELATTPAHPDWLVGVFGEAWVYVYDVTDPTAPSLLGSVFSPGTASSINDIAVTPNGADVLVASGAPSELQALALPGLTADGVYPTDSYPNSVAVSADGSLIASGSESFYDRDVFLFPAGSSTAKSTWDFNSTNDLLYPHGLAFSADGTRLYAVSEGASGNAAVLRVLPAVTLPKGAVSVKTSASTIAAGHALTVTAHLGTASSNRTVSIYRKPVNGKQVLVKKGTVGPAGNLAATVRPTANATYTAVWGGDTTHAQTTSPGRSVKVRLVVHAAAKGGYRTAAGVRLYHYTAACGGARHTGCPTFAVSTTPALPKHVTGVVVQARIGGIWRKVLSGSQRVGANGKLLLVIFYNGRGVVGVPQRIRFTFAKDAAHLGNTSAWVKFRVTS